jgi:hypothetical protein
LLSQYFNAESKSGDENELGLLDREKEDFKAIIVADGGEREIRAEPPPDSSSDSRLAS